MLQDRRLRFVIAPLVFAGSIMMIMILDPYFRLSDFLQPTAGKDSDSGLNAFAVGLGLLAGGGVGIFAMGFVISQLTLAFLHCRCIGLWWYGWSKKKNGTVKMRHLLSVLPFKGIENSSYEVELPTCVLTKLSEKLNEPSGNDAKSDVDTIPRDALPLIRAAVFDHHFLRENARGVHEWIGRRYNHFLVTANCVVAILFSWAGWLLLVSFFLARPNTQWWGEFKEIAGPIDYLGRSFWWLVLWTSVGAIFIILLTVTGRKARRDVMQMIIYTSRHSFE